LGGRGAPSDGGYINIYSTNNEKGGPVRVVPPPHAAIEPSALRAAKAKLFE
jgi:hypothetical protein